jgi:hypothetical protein
MGHNGLVTAASKLTEALRAEVERELAAGHPVAVVAQRHGIGRRTLGRWLAEGRVTRRQVAPEPNPQLEELSLDERLARAEPGLMAAIPAANQRGSWQAASWLLERINPQRWGSRSGSRRAGRARRTCPTRSGENWTSWRPGERASTGGEVGKAELPPEGSNLRLAAERVAEVFGCPVEEAHEVLLLGIEARQQQQQREKREGGEESEGGGVGQHRTRA